MRGDLVAAGSRELSLGYLKRKVITRIWVAAKRTKVVSVLIDIVEVLVTSPFKTKQTQSFYAVAQFYRRFEPNGILSLDFLCWLQRCLYDYKYFTEFELKALYDSAAALCSDTRVKISKSTQSARLTQPIESVMSTMSSRLPPITLKL